MEVKEAQGVLIGYITGDREDGPLVDEAEKVLDDATKDLQTPVKSPVDGCFGCDFIIVMSMVA